MQLTLSSEDPKTPLKWAILLVLVFLPPTIFFPSSREENIDMDI
jgi:hypothetical protein